MVVIKTEEWFLSLFHFRKVAIPRHNVILVLIIENHLRVHKVFNDLLPSAVLKEFRPCRADPRAFLIVMDERIVVQVERRSHVDVKARDAGEQYKYYDCVDTISDDRAFTKTEVPYLLTHVIWQAEARFFAHALQAATAAVDGVFCQEKDNRSDNESQEAKDDEKSEADQREELIHFMFNVCDNFETAELANFFHRPIFWHDRKPNQLRQI